MARMSRPLKAISPVMRAVGGSSPMTAMEVIDLPHPDSPTRPMVSPGRTEKETLSTMSTSPCWAGKAMDRPFTSRTGSACGEGGTRRSVRASSAARRAARRSASGTVPAAPPADSGAGPGPASAPTASRARMASSSASTSAASTRVRMDGEAMASVRPSDRTLRHRVVMRIIRPGKKVGHQWPDMRSSLPSESILPQVGVLTDLMPALRKDREASKTMASATRTVA